MESYQQDFLKLALNEEGVLPTEALLLGEFTLKSGRQSPYFFQAGAFNNGFALNKIGQCLAHAIHHHRIDCQHLFGPAYKGIPLVSATAIALATLYHQNIPWSFNRKMRKDHGEGGHFVGAKLEGKILIIDDVLTAGTAIKQSLQLIRKENRKAQICGVLTLLDRDEISANDQNAKTLIEKQFNIPVYSIVSIHDVLSFLHQQQRKKDIQAIEKHRQHGLSHSTGTR